jgi:CheY-like chemotaxis protein
VAELQAADQFRSLLRKDDLLAEGVHAVFGLRDGRAELQGLHFRADRFTPAEAQRWLRERGFRPLSFAAAPGGAAAPPADGRPAPRLRVLVAEDNHDAADSLALLVRLWGHEVRVAYDGASALTLASAYRPDVVLLDLAMPRLDGYAVARQLRERAEFRATRLVAVTGYADEAHRARSKEEGFDEFLVKPVEPATLHALLRNIGRAQQLTSELQGLTLQTQALTQEAYRLIQEGRQADDAIWRPPGGESRLC